ncbi:hypothetical protein Glove_50g77 [Diversispora epigaea]|uniref:Uncharacterized protein n=1 Tax=Diversispora epigaea TaxID=1348612 RepID=A0A397JDU1_9GLOM|nr:hypothetical protein Glove_50g77 [Diversispora epigaea]
MSLKFLKIYQNNEKSLTAHSNVCVKYQLMMKSLNHCAKIKNESDCFRVATSFNLDLDLQSESPQDNVIHYVKEDLSCYITEVKWFRSYHWDALSKESKTEWVAWSLLNDGTVFEPDKSSTKDISTTVKVNKVPHHSTAQLYFASKPPKERSHNANSGGGVVETLEYPKLNGPNYMESALQGKSKNQQLLNVIEIGNDKGITNRRWAFRFKNVE